jgi:hypothetical protein
MRSIWPISSRSRTTRADAGRFRSPTPPRRSSVCGHVGDMLLLDEVGGVAGF